MLSTRRTPPPRRDLPASLAGGRGSPADLVQGRSRDAVRRLRCSGGPLSRPQDEAISSLSERPGEAEGRRSPLSGGHFFIEIKVGVFWPATMMTLMIFFMGPSFAVTRIAPAGNGSFTIGGTKERPAIVT